MLESVESHVVHLDFTGLFDFLPDFFTNDAFGENSLCVTVFHSLVVCRIFFSEFLLE